jgi:hypothetical protein
MGHLAIPGTVGLPGVPKAGCLAKHGETVGFWWIEAAKPTKKKEIWWNEKN